jgi:hypothetical protein
MERIGALMIRGDSPLARFLGLVLTAETTYVLAVRAVLGEPPVPLVTVSFAMLVAGGLAAQEHRSRHDRVSS